MIIDQPCILDETGKPAICARAIDPVWGEILVPAVPTHVVRSHWDGQRCVSVSVDAWASA